MALGGRLREVSENKGLDNPLWLVIYADLITNLMIFFLMMFAFTYAGSANFEKMAKSLESEFGKERSASEMKEEMQKEQETEAAKKVEEAVKDQLAKEDVEVKIDQEVIKLRMSSPVLFDAGSADLRPEFKAILTPVASILRGMPNGVVVEGHTDNRALTGRGRYRSNLELSTARAAGVIEYFIKEQGLDPKRFSAAGYGEYRPLGDNETPENRSRNRRIEITILREGGSKKGGGAPSGGGEKG